MKIAEITNGTLTIQANANKEGDYAEAWKVAEKMVEESQGGIDFVSADDTEQWVQLGAVWSNFQAKELKELYQEAKAA